MQLVPLFIAIVSVLFVSCGGATVSAGADRDGTRAAATGVLVSEISDNPTDLLDLDVEQTASPMVFRGDRTVDIPLEIALRNRSEEPLELKRVVVESVGGSAYRIGRQMRSYKGSVEPGAERKLKFWATVDVDGTPSTVSAPMAMRITAVVMRGDVEVREAFIRRINGRVQIDVTRNSTASGNPPPPAAQPVAMPGKSLPGELGQIP